VTVAGSRTFKSGNSEAVRLPKDVAFGNGGELIIVRSGDVMSIVTRVELEGGVYRVPEYSAIRRARLDVLIAAIPALSFDDLAASFYADILAKAGYSRRKILDRMIAAQALAHRATLIAMNADDFSDIAGLELLKWS
jgi:predicted nucleic acid-binding protein